MKKIGGENNGMKFGSVSITMKIEKILMERKIDRHKAGLKINNLNPRQENLNTVRMDRLSPESDSSIYSYSIEDDKAFLKIISELNYDKILVGFEAEKRSDILEEVTPKTIEKIAINKKKEYIECTFVKETFVGEAEFIEQLYCLAQANDFVYFVLNPVRNKKYYNLSTGKIYANITSKDERVFWFDYDANDLYFTKSSD